MKDQWDEDEEQDRLFELYAHIGQFIAMFSMAELSLTALLAVTAKSPDFEVFHTLTLGMDLRAKADRLRMLCSSEKRIVPDSKFDVRLKFFEDKVNKLRNKIAHSVLAFSQEKEGTILLTNLARLPFENIGVTRLYGIRPDEVSIISLDEHSTWLADFHHDLVSLFPSARSGKALEITRPRSTEPKVFLANLQQLKNRAKKRTPRQKPKGQ